MIYIRPPWMHCSSQYSGSQQQQPLPSTVAASSQLAAVPEDPQGLPGLLAQAGALSLRGPGVQGGQDVLLTQDLCQDTH